MIFQRNYLSVSGIQESHNLIAIVLVQLNLKTFHLSFSDHELSPIKGESSQSKKPTKSSLHRDFLALSIRKTIVRFPL